MNYRILGLNIVQGLGAKICKATHKHRHIGICGPGKSFMAFHFFSIFKILFFSNLTHCAWELFNTCVHMKSRNNVTSNSDSLNRFVQLVNILCLFEKTMYLVSHSTRLSQFTPFYSTWIKARQWTLYIQISRRHLMPFHIRGC